MSRAAGQGLLGLPWEFLSHLSDQSSGSVTTFYTAKAGEIGEPRSGKGMQPTAQLEFGNKNAPGDEEMNYGRPGELDYREIRGGGPIK
jgi:hypothetical protein